MPENNSSQSQPGHHSPELPEQLKKQIIDADAMITALSKGEPPAQEPSPSNSADPATAPPAAGDGAQPPAAPASSIQPPEDEQTWEQRFKSQQGRFDQMLRANQVLSERIAEMQASIQAMHARGLEAPQPPQPAAERERQRYVKDEEVEEYGEEFMDVVARRAMETYAPEVDEIAERVKRLESRVDGVGQVVETTVKRGLVETLTDAVPNWREINNSPAFKAWVQIPDPYSGRLRYDMIKEAYAGHETSRVIAFFKGFLSEAAGLPTTSQARTPSAPPPANGSGSGKPSLEQFAAPGRARSAPQNLPPEKFVYTQAWIAKFYADKLAGKYRGRDDDVAAVEQDIFAAQHEGRIQ